MCGERISILRHTSHPTNCKFTLQFAVDNPTIKYFASLACYIKRFAVLLSNEELCTIVLNGATRTASSPSESSGRQKSICNINSAVGCVRALIEAHHGKNGEDAAIKSKLDPAGNDKTIAQEIKNTEKREAFAIICN